MAANKGNKTELNAIYRLEFYKNKKNWKLSQDKMKSVPRSPSPKKPLNQTYDLDGESDEEQVSLHNKAFVYEDPEEARHVETPMELELGDPPASDQPHQHTWMHEPWPEDKADARWQDAKQVWRDADSADVCDGPCHLDQRAWTSENQYSPHKAHFSPEELKRVAENELLQAADKWLQFQGYTLSEEFYEPYGVLNDSAHFARGAHAAPHSSETDLSLTPPEEYEYTPPHALWTLSPRQLQREVQRRALGLRDVLQEYKLREQLYSASAVPLPLPYEEYPTRDTDPPQVADVVLSGSRPLSGLSGPLFGSDGAGRGRGRLHQQDKIIGIGMGRPYRL